VLAKQEGEANVGVNRHLWHLKTNVKMPRKFTYKFRDWEILVALENLKMPQNLFMNRYIGSL